MIILLMMIVSMVNNAYSSCGLPLKSVETIFSSTLAAALRERPKELDTQITQARGNETQQRNVAAKQNAILTLRKSRLFPQNYIWDFNNINSPSLLNLLEKLPSYDPTNKDEIYIDDVRAILSLAYLEPKADTNLQRVTLNLSRKNLQSLAGLATIYNLLKEKNYILDALDVSNNNIQDLELNHASLSCLTLVDISNNPITMTTLSHFTGNEKFTLIMQDKPLSYPLRMQIAQQLWPEDTAAPFFTKCARTIRSAVISIPVSLCVTIATVNALLVSPFLAIKKIPKLSPKVPLVFASPFLYLFKKSTQWGKKIGAYQKPPATNQLIYDSKHHRKKSMQNFYPFCLQYRLVTKTLSDIIYMPFVNAVIRM